MKLGEFDPPEMNPYKKYDTATVTIVWYDDILLLSTQKIIV